MPTILTDDMPTEVEDEDIRALREVGAIKPAAEPGEYDMVWSGKHIVEWLERRWLDQMFAKDA